MVFSWFLNHFEQKFAKPKQSVIQLVESILDLIEEHFKKDLKFSQALISNKNLLWSKHQDVL